eukprot:TRINITY_DN4520_c0_g2_i1.p1 TRINITY_DN4520_c0_g2~~TRINITY_DN4520_c0_g2_i1.p1  ORF type:complete len:175 (-),score=23.37 TRINITY_DN4520_c0_g2_i1:8-532(-)
MQFDPLGKGYLAVCFTVPTDSRNENDTNFPNDARVWNLNTGKYCKLEGHIQTISDIKFSCNSEYIITGGYDGSLRVWNNIEGDFRNFSQKLPTNNNERLLKVDCHPKNPLVYSYFSMVDRLTVGHLNKIQSDNYNIGRHLWFNNPTEVRFFGENKLVPHTDGRNVFTSYMHIWA